MLRRANINNITVRLSSRKGCFRLRRTHVGEDVRECERGIIASRPFSDRIASFFIRELSRIGTYHTTNTLFGVSGVIA